MLGLMNRDHGHAAYSNCEMLKAWEKEARDRALAVLRLTTEPIVAEPLLTMIRMYKLWQQTDLCLRSRNNCGGIPSFWRLYPKSRALRLDTLVTADSWDLQRLFVALPSRKASFATFDSCAQS
jgi:hypothetical protein